MDDLNVFQYHYDGTKLDVSDYTGTMEAPSIRLNSQEHLDFQSYYGAGTTLTMSPSLFAMPTAFTQDQLNPFDSGDSGIVPPSRVANVTSNHPMNESFTEVQSKPTSAKASISPTAVPSNKPSRRRYSPEKWAIIQLVVESLYIDQGRPLHETMRILEKEHGFKTSYVQAFYYST